MDIRQNRLSSKESYLIQRRTLYHGKIVDPSGRRIAILKSICTKKPEKRVKQKRRRRNEKLAISQL